MIETLSLVLIIHALSALIICYYFKCQEKMFVLPSYCSALAEPWTVFQSSHPTPDSSLQRIFLLFLPGFLCRFLVLCFCFSLYFFSPICSLPSLVFPVVIFFCPLSCFSTPFTLPCLCFWFYLGTIFRAGII